MRLILARLAWHFDLEVQGASKVVLWSKSSLMVKLKVRQGAYSPGRDLIRFSGTYSACRAVEISYSEAGYANMFALGRCATRTPVRSLTCWYK